MITVVIALLRTTASQKNFLHYPLDSYFLCHYFVFLNNSIRISIPWLFRTYFHTKIFSNYNFHTHYNVGSSTILIESLKFRKNSRIKVVYPSNLLSKLWIWDFWILCFVIIFLEKRSCKAWLKMTLPKNKPMQKCRQHWGMPQLENSQKGKCKVYCYKL